MRALNSIFIEIQVTQIYNNKWNISIISSIVRYVYAFHPNDLFGF